MEIVRQLGIDSTSFLQQSRAPDEQRCAPSMPLRSAFPADAVARIYRPSRSVMTSGKARSRHWRLIFARRSAPFTEPLMGWTGGSDTLSQVELKFPTLEAAIRYAERQGLAYAVQAPAGMERPALHADTTLSPDAARMELPVAEEACPVPLPVSVREAA